MIPATRVTSLIFKMAARRLRRAQRSFTTREAVEIVLQPGSDEEEDIVGAFPDSNRELLDSD